MKIAMISASTVPSTTANSLQVMKTAQAAAELGHEVLLLLPGTQKVPFDGLAAAYGLRTVFMIEWLPSPRIWRRYDLAWKAISRARRWKADLIYTWMPQAALLGLWRGHPALLELHDLPSGILGPAVFRLFWKARGRKRLLPITQTLLERARSEYSFTPLPEEVVVSPNGVDLERFTGLPEPGAARLTLGLPEGFTAVYSGHFYPGRGMELLFSLAKQCPDMNFLWVGGRPEAVDQWKSRLQAEGVQNVTLTGFIPNRDLPRYQAAGDVLLMPYERRIAGSSGGDSAAIASPMKMFEYLACGRAILTSDLPVIREVLNEENACFCPPEDVESWLNALVRLRAEPEIREKLGRQALQDAGQYTWIERTRKALAGL